MYTFLDAPDDTEAVLKSKRVIIVLGEQAPRTRRGTPEEHADQLAHLMQVSRLPFVSVGIIPAGAHRQAIASIGFWIFDESAVALETPTAAIKVTGPQEVALYLSLFSQLQAEAIYGHDARRLIAEVLANL